MSAQGVEADANAVAAFGIYDWGCEEKFLRVSRDFSTVCRLAVQALAVGLIPVAADAAFDFQWHAQFGDVFHPLLQFG